MNFRKNLNFLILIYFTPSINKRWKPFLWHKSFFLLLLRIIKFSAKRGSQREDHEASQRGEDHQTAQRGEDHQAAQGVQSSRKQFLSLLGDCSILVWKSYTRCFNSTLVLFYINVKLKPNSAILSITKYRNLRKYFNSVLKYMHNFWYAILTTLTQ